MIVDDAMEKKSTSDRFLLNIDQTICLKGLRNQSFNQLRSVAEK
jgi:hypothetical protein